MTTTDPAALQAEIARLTAENAGLRQTRSKQWQIGNLAAETANGNEPLATKQDADELRGIAYYALRELWKLNGIYIGETKKVEELEKDKSELKELVLSLAKQSDQFRQRADTYRRRALALLAQCNKLRDKLAECADYQLQKDRAEYWVEYANNAFDRLEANDAELATLRAALAASQARERRLREALEDMVNQHCTYPDGRMNHSCISANEDAMKLLEGMGRLEKLDKRGQWFRWNPETESALSDPAPSGDGAGEGR